MTADAGELTGKQTHAHTASKKRKQGTWQLTKNDIKRVRKRLILV